MFEPETDTESKDKPYTKDTPCERAAIHHPLYLLVC